MKNDQLLPFVTAESVQAFCASSADQGHAFIDGSIDTILEENSNLGNIACLASQAAPGIVDSESFLAGFCLAYRLLKFQAESDELNDLMRQSPPAA